MAVTETTRGSPPEAGVVRTDLIEPDLDFIDVVARRIGPSYLKCMQCGTCTATCSLSPDESPFPRKEVVWAAWGWKDRLLTDPDVWLCHQCNDCSTRCPRSAHPGDLLAAIRQESIIHYAWPKFVAKWVNDIRYIPVLLGIPTVLLGAALWLRQPLGQALGFEDGLGERIVYSYSSVFPHWLLNSFFLFFTALMLVAAVVGVRRFAGRMQQAIVQNTGAEPVKSTWASLGSVLKDVLVHENFTKCETAHIRFWSHPCFLFGFLALTLVTLWVITSGINPLIRGEFVYPFNFLSPWKILANVGGLAVVAGCVLTIRERLFGTAYNTAGNYYDWSFLLTLIAVALTGFATEIMHYFRMEPHRHVMYFIHLVFVFALLMYLPFSKFAHVLYRTTAMVLSVKFGRRLGDETVEAEPAVQAEAAPAKEEAEAEPEPATAATGGETP